jgi:BetI-type transcriptional repressor, C-terminal
MDMRDCYSLATAPRTESWSEARTKRSALRNRDIPGLVELYATLTTDALRQDRHPATREFVRDRFRRVRAELADLVRQAQRTGMVGSEVDPDDAAALVVAASDGLQVQWLLDPDAVDVHRVLRLLEHLVSVDAAGREPSR